MPFVCDPPNTVPSVVVQLADKYEYSCAQKIKPIQNIGDYDAYGVIKYNGFLSFILYKDNKARFATYEENRKMTFLCNEDFKCTPIEIINNEFHYIEGF